ncbi:MAG: hypothetical protein L0191_21150 [Acidobacteria bacterium]|nr:hypothetical protein [Acidobacteriota bacterium]
MKRNRLLRTAAALGLLVQMQIAVASSARAEEPNLAADLSAGAISTIATAIAFPVRLIACVATVGLGGLGYGFTMGTSELLRQELVAGTKYTCGGKYYVTPQEVKRLAGEAQRQQ